MNDPHVKRLHYSVAVGKEVDYKEAKSLRAETADFGVVINQEVATFDMKRHFATPEEARSFIEPFVRSWEVSAGIEGHDGFRLVYKSAEVVDRAPSRKDRTISVRGGSVIHVTTDAILHLSRGDYPNPPTSFAVSPEVETMFSRYKLCRKGRESILSTAYMCLTVLEASAANVTTGSNRRENAANKYCISIKVLNILGELTSTRGDEREARKALQGGFAPLTQKEKQWIEAVVRTMIRRAGERAHNPDAQLREITMSDFGSI